MRLPFLAFGDVIFARINMFYEARFREFILGYIERVALSVATSNYVNVERRI